MRSPVFRTSGARRRPPAVRGFLNRSWRTSLCSRASSLLRFLNDKHQPGDPEFAFFPPHAAYPKGRELYPRLQTTPGYKPDQIINKTTFDGFFATILDKTLRQFNIKTVIVVGTVSNICVLATAQSARLLGYNVIIPEDCISSLSPLGHAILLHQVQTVLGGQIVAKAEDITFELRK